MILNLAKKQVPAETAEHILDCCRLQNSLYFCVFKYARAVKQKVWNEAENRERDWRERACEARLLCHALSISLLILRKNTGLFCSLGFESTRNAFISFNSEINFVQFLYKNVQLTNKIVFAFNKKIRSTFVKYAPSPPPPKKKSRWRGYKRLSPEAWRSLSNHQCY